MREVAHQKKERNDGEREAAECARGLGGEKRERGLPADDETAADEPRHAHGYTDRHMKRDQRKHEAETKQAGEKRIHEAG